jgi:hypothetical protein
VLRPACVSVIAVESVAHVPTAPQRCTVVRLLSSAFREWAFPPTPPHLPPVVTFVLVSWAPGGFVRQPSHSSHRAVRHATAQCGGSHSPSPSPSPTPLATQSCPQL